LVAECLVETVDFPRILQRLAGENAAIFGEDDAEILETVVHNLCPYGSEVVEKGDRSE
jgi:hypothetical protein